MTFAAGSVHRAPKPVILEDIMWVQSLRCEHVAVTVSRKAGASKICNRGLWKEVMRARWQSQALSLDLEEFGLNVAAVMYQAIPAVDLLRRRSWDMLAQAYLSYRDLENQNMERPNNSSADLTWLRPSECQNNEVFGKLEMLEESAASPT